MDPGTLYIQFTCHHKVSWIFTTAAVVMRLYWTKTISPAIQVDKSTETNLSVAKSSKGHPYYPMHRW